MHTLKGSSFFKPIFPHWISCCVESELKINPKNTKLKVLYLDSTMYYIIHNLADMNPYI